MLREGSGEPLVLFHGVLNSERVWSTVAPLLAPRHEVIALSALGHHGGPEPTEHPVTIDLIVDTAERQLDELGLERPHLAGNSLGGWMALELAQRGRAQTVCAFSPAGFWEEAWPDRERAFKVLLAARRDARRARHIAPFVARSALIRRWAMRDACRHGDRITREQFVFASEDVIACDIAEELIKPGSNLEPFDAPCPVTIAWGAEDRIFPLPLYEERGRTLVGGAEFLVLDDVGHVPMYDDPQLVADTMLAVTKRSASSPSAPGS